jgi:hypothetical protein
MSEQFQKLPIDLQSFEIIREEGFLYVDKTRYIHQMIEDGRYYFMARPRRFGKTLMVSVLRNLFTGNRALFDGLWIAAHGNWQWQSFPVVVLDFNAISHDTPENLKLDLSIALERIARESGIVLSHPLLKGKLQQLVLELHRQSNQPVVVLIDEYDKPIIDHLGKGEAALEIARANRDILKAFLGTLKGADVARRTRFVFITGVSKFSRVSIFSDLNNLIDIGMSPKYAAMLGYTEQEVESHFKANLHQLAQARDLDDAGALARLKQQYDGYRFSKKLIRVYNPFSVLRALSELDFENYWFDTGTPSFLINLLKERDYPLPDIEDLAVAESVFSVYDLESLGVEALLFQTGYLTIKDVHGRLFTLGYPNQEVKTSFMESLLYSFAPPEKADGVSRFLMLAEYLENEDLKAFFTAVNAIFASIPYTLKGEPNEAWFHTLFYLMVSASGAQVQSEVLTSRGRIDLVVVFSDKIWIMEFKCNQSAEAGLKQIHEKGYADRFKGLGKKLVLMGIGFDSRKRCVSGWRVETI